MNAVKNALVITLLLGVGYGVYRMVNKQVETPLGIDVEMPKMSDSVSMGRASMDRNPMDHAAMDKGSLASSPTNEPYADSTGGSMSRSPEPASGNRPVEVASPYRSGASHHEQHASPHSHDMGDPDSLAGRGDPSSRPNTAYPASSVAPSPQIQPPLDRSAEIQSKVASRKQEVKRKQIDPASFPDAWDSAQRLLQAGELAQAHLQLSPYYGNRGLSRADDIKLSKLLSQLAGTVIYSKSEHLLRRAYTVKRGEALEQIAWEHRVTPELLAKINQLSLPATIRAGDQLKVVEGPFHAVIDLSREEITLTLAGRFAGRFDIVRAGLDFSVPKSTTEYRVIEQNNRDGDHWIGLGERMGIHAEMTGSASSRTMHNSLVVGDQDAAELFDILSNGSKVTILVAAQRAGR